MQFAESCHNSLPKTQKTTCKSYVPKILLVILLLAACLRLFDLRRSPPGLNQDEAANAWNAYCLLKTGKDQAGVSWPIFYTRALGGNSSTLYLYLIIPFQAVGGLNVVTARLPAAVGGVLTVLIIYFVGKRLFDRKIGLAAAALLTLNPWHIQQSRWGHEASIAALLGILPLALLLWANIPISDEQDRKPRPIRAVLAGAISGLCCYGYHSARLFIPIFLMGICLATLPGWRRLLKTRRVVWSLALFTLGWSVTFGPLAAQHIFHPEGIGRHSQFQVSLLAANSLAVGLKNVALRYLQHFGPDFLFINGDPYPIQSPPGIGQFHWYMLPLMVMGLMVLVRRFRSSCAARVLMVYLLVYPVGDCFYQGYGMHALRSSLGLCSLILLAAVGAVTTGRWLGRRSRPLALIIAVAFAGAVVALNIRYLHRFYGDYNRQEEIYHGFYSDLVEACAWLRPLVDNDEVDAVFCSTDGMGMAYIITLVCLEHEPDRWFNQERAFKTLGEFDFYSHYGRMYFMYDRSFQSALTELQQNHRPDRVVFITRPGELGSDIPVRQKFGPDGKTTLCVYCTLL